VGTADQVPTLREKASLNFTYKVDFTIMTAVRRPEHPWLTLQTKLQSRHAWKAEAGHLHWLMPHQPNQVSAGWHAACTKAAVAIDLSSPQPRSYKIVRPRKQHRKTQVAIDGNIASSATFTPLGSTWAATKARSRRHRVSHAPPN